MLKGSKPKVWAFSAWRQQPFLCLTPRPSLVSVSQQPEPRPMRQKGALEATQLEREAADEAVAAGPDKGEARRIIEDHELAAGAKQDLKELLKLFTAAEKTAATSTKDAEAVRTGIDAAKAEVDRARTAVTQAEEASKAGPDPVELATARTAHREHGEAVSKLPPLQEATTTARETAAKTEATLAEAEAFRAVTDRKRGETIRAHGAAGLIAELVVGEECPVCRQTVTAIPDHHVDAELAAAKKEWDEAALAVAGYQLEVDAARKLLAEAEAEERYSTTRMVELELKLADAPDEAELDKLDVEVEALQLVVEERSQVVALAVAAQTELEDSEQTAAVLETERAATEEYIKSESARENKKDELEALQQRLDGARTVKQLEGDIAKAESLAAALTAAREAETAAADASESAAAAFNRVKDEEQTERAAFGVARDGLAVLKPPSPAGESLVSDWLEFADWASDRADELEKAHSEANEIVAELEDEHAVGESEARALADPFGADGDDLEKLTLAELVTFLVRRAERATTEFEQADKARHEYATLQKQVKALQEEEVVSRQLGSLLRVDGFERWLMEEVIADLLERATDRLVVLSDGQYSLVAEESDFLIRDHRNADELRDVKTLSGGETFLASLALALGLADALADVSAESAPALESIFLDEGFGTLDPETLDVVASAIEELGASGRMVGIVTHIRELADRMPARFEVTRGATSSSVERVET